MTSCTNNASATSALQVTEGHQNCWKHVEKTNIDVKKSLMAIPIHGGRSRDAQRHSDKRERLKAEGLVHIRLLLPPKVHQALCALRDRHGYSNLHSTIDTYVQAVSRLVNIAHIDMPRRHSSADPYVECNIAVSEETRTYLDDIKRMHGLSRYYALEALLAALPDPWAVRPGSVNSIINPENAVSG